MKKALLLSLLLASGVFAQTSGIVGQASTDRVPSTGTVSIQDATAGQLGPVIFTQTMTLPKGGVVATSRWFHIGWSPSHTSATANNSNKAIVPFNPDIVTFVLKDFTPTPTHADNDSVGIGELWFESAYDTTDDAIWNGDTSNFNIENSAGNRPDYGVWTFKPFKRVATDTTDFAYTAKVLIGGYLRVGMKGWNNTDNGSILDDSCTVILQVVTER